MRKNQNRVGGPIVNIWGPVGIVAHPGKPEAADFADTLQKYVTEMFHRPCEILPRLTAARKDHALLLVLGGDGFFMHAASHVASKGFPALLLGVNLGHKGFLTLADTSTWEGVLGRVFHDDFVVEERLALDIACGDRMLHAVNDVYLRHPDGMIVAKVEVDGATVFENLIADGIVVCTPMGSSGYNMSVGGPLIMPTMDCFVISPIAAMAFNARPLVISPLSTIQITLVGSRAENRNALPRLKKDGKACPPLHPGESMLVFASKKRARCVSFGTSTFFDALHLKAGLLQ